MAVAVTIEACVARAVEGEREAAAATLDNVRTRCLRSAAAWHAMANRTALAEAQRLRARSA